MSAFLDLPRPRAFAHRGWHLDDLAGSENTMAAFTRAVDEGYRYLETDVQTTADGRLVVFHDAVLDRVTDARGLLRQRTWEDLRGVRVAGAHPIPAFEDLLDLLRAHPQVRLNVDAKTDSAVPPLVQALRDSGVADRVCLAAFADSRLARLQALMGPGVASSLGPRRIARLAITSGRGRQPSAAVAVQVPPRLRGWTVVPGILLTAAHRAGLEVHVWTIDDPARMHALLDAGVDGIMTDRPDLLRQVIQERGSW